MAYRWYVVHINTGFEDRVKALIEERVKLEGMEVSVHEV